MERVLMEIAEALKEISVSLKEKVELDKGLLESQRKVTDISEQAWNETKGKGKK